MAKRPILTEEKQLFGGVIAKYGITTAPGAGAGNSFKDDSLIGMWADSFVSMVTVLYPGDSVRVDSARNTAFNNGTGEVTLEHAYKGVAAPIPIGVPYIILTLPFATAAGLAVIKTQTDKLAGVPGTNGNLSRNWFTNVYPAESTLVTIGAPLYRAKLHLLIVGISTLVGNINIRLYTDVNGTEQRIFPPKPLTWNVATDAPGVAVINGTLGLRNALRVTVQSDNALDDLAIVSYEYLLEAM